MTWHPTAAPMRIFPVLAGVAATVLATPAAAAMIVEVNDETRQPQADCRAAWDRLTREYRRKATGQCKDAGGVASVAEPETGKKPVGGKFICTLKGRITCNE
jgi:hypothetical protein